MIKRKKGKTPKGKKWQSNTSLWVGKSYRDNLLPKHVGISVVIHVIFFIALVNFSKYYLLNHIKPVVKNIEFNLPKTHTRLQKKPVPETTVAESAAASQENTVPQEHQKPSDNHRQSTKNTNSQPAKNATAQTSTATDNASDDDFIPMSKIKRSASSFSKSFSGASGTNSDEASGGGSTAASSQGGIKGSKEVSGYDISPYVNELRRNVKMNWKVPSGVPSKRVELFLRIAKDGKIMILNVKTTSESAPLDESTLEAVRRTTPLRPIPSKYPKAYLDVVFAFNAADASVR